MFENSEKNAVIILSNFVNSEIENPDLSEVFAAIKSLHTDEKYSSMARSALIKLADEPYNYHEAQYEIGCCYLNGRQGFEESRELAFEYFKKSAKQNNFNAFLELSDGNEGIAFAWAMDNKKNHFLKYLIDNDPDLLLEIPDSK